MDNSIVYWLDGMDRQLMLILNYDGGVVQDLVLAGVLVAADMGASGCVLRVPALCPAAAVDRCGCAALRVGADRDAVRPGIVGTD